MRFRLGSIPVTVRASFFFITFLLAPRYYRELALTLQWMGVVFVSVLWHELGHAVAVRAYGMAPSIELLGMGGLTRYVPPAGFPPRRKIAITFAGPFAGLVLGAIVWATWRAVPSLSSTFQGELLYRELLWANFGWSVLNLLPVGMLDGGQIASTALTAWFGKAGEFTARVLSFGVAASLVAWGIHTGETWPLVLAAFVFILSIQSQGAKAGRAAFVEAHAALEAGDANQALEKLAPLARDHSPPVNLLRARALSMLGRHAEAVEPLQDAMLDLGRAGQDDLAVRHALDTALFHAGRFSEASVVAEEGFRLSREPFFAYNAACSHARLGDAARALEWLSRAVDAGYDDLAALEADDDLAPARALPAYGALRERLATSSASRAGSGAR